MNYLKGLVISLTITAFLSPGILAAEDLIHTVERGETLYAISRSYRISADELMRYNNITDASSLQVGRRLLIPSATASSAANPQSFTEYLVVRNDTLYGISRTHGVTLQALLDINGFPQNHVLKAGDRIKVPVLAATRTTTSQPAQNTPVVPVLSESRQLTSRTVDPSLRWPVKAREVAYMTGKLYGVVVQGERSESVKSLTHGTVMSAGPYRGFGRVVIVEVSGGYLYVYGGCESLSVKKGDRVGPGEELGKLGIDALSEKPQLFFMVYRSNAPIDPAIAPRA
ncbi:MAG: LysM peptidoglycan-binding domain-containing protein [Treponema sp.]|nr:LysM peptidoglycan-binding domain-containing protein [Treponema sp.]